MAQMPIGWGVYIIRYILLPIAWVLFFNSKLQLNRDVTMKKLFLSSALILVTGCASTGPESIATNDTRSCAQNFTHEGNLMTGKIFKTNDIVPLHQLALKQL